MPNSTNPRKQNNTIETLSPGEIGVLGIPFDGNSSFRKGPAMGPARIREALDSPSANRFSESGVELDAGEFWRDVGDLQWPGEELDLERVEAVAGRILARGARVMTLGGDHSITYPLVKAYLRWYPDLNILHLDAHPDLYHSLYGNPLSHACPFARIMETGKVARLVQVGIRTLTDHQRNFYHSYIITCTWGAFNHTKAEKTLEFSSREEMDREVKAILHARIGEGYHILYQYPGNLFAEDALRTA